MKTLPLIILLASTLLANQCFAEEGHTQGNGGDAIYENGELVLRDFASKQDLILIQDNQQFATQFGEYTDMITQIAQIDPKLADFMNTQLNNKTIWLTEKPLPQIVSENPYYSKPGSALTPEMRKVVLPLTETDVLISKQNFMTASKSRVLLSVVLMNTFSCRWGQCSSGQINLRESIEFLETYRGRYISKRFLHASLALFSFDSERLRTLEETDPE